MRIRLGVAKVPRFGVPESGDTLEVVERRGGGLSVVIADGQGTGLPAKRISNLVVSRAISLISEGARDGAVARAVHDVLHGLRDGKVSCELTILSADLHTRTLVVSRNTSVPVWVVSGGSVTVCSEASCPIGVGESVRPTISEFPLAPGIVAATFTDGILYSGLKSGHGQAEAETVQVLRGYGPDQAERIGDALLEMGLRRDCGRPQDDMTAVALGVAELGDGQRIRKMSVSFPV